MTSENHTAASGAGGGAPVGGGGSLRGGARKPLVLRDRGEKSGSIGVAKVNAVMMLCLTIPTLCPLVATMDSMFRPVEGTGPEAAAAAASPNTYVDAIRTGLGANATEQSE